MGVVIPYPYPYSYSIQRPTKTKWTNTNTNTITITIELSMAAMKAYAISVPTKQGDGETMMIRHLVGASQQQQDDAFSRYSNDFVRMKSLLLSSKEYDGDDDLEALQSSGCEQHSPSQPR
jgi:hypothetical protein